MTKSGFIISSGLGREKFDIGCNLDKLNLFPRQGRHAPKLGQERADSRGQ